MRKILVKVDPELCIGAASCVAVDPDHFELNDDNKAVVLEPKTPKAPKIPKTYERTVEVTDEEYETLLLSAQSCPTLAISLFDEDGQQVFPKN